jgi:PAS domain S-box-containing protein
MLFMQENNKTFSLANIIDITERKKADEALIKSQLLLMSSIESQKDTIIFSMDQNYCYLYFNTAHLDSMKFAYNKDVKIGMNILNCISKDNDRKLLKENFDLALSGKSHSLIQTFGDANIAYYEVFYSPIVNEKDEIIGCTGLARNITERKKAEQELKDSETKFKEIINQINDAIIVFDEQGKIPFEPQTLNFKKISEEAVAILKPHADVKNIKINHFAEDEINIFADIFMLKTILRNLVSNAIKFSTTDGQININAKETPSNVTISVWNNGTGITPDYLTKLFDISQIHSTLGAAEEKGTTLGLLLCKEFVEKHSGEIWVESANGKGCEFKFTMPVKASALGHSQPD